MNGTTVYQPIPNCTVIYHHCRSLGNTSLMQLCFFHAHSLPVARRLIPIGYWLIAVKASGTGRAHLFGTEPAVYTCGVIVNNSSCECHGQRDGEISRGPTFGDFVTFCHYPHRGVDAGHHSCRTIEYQSTESPLPPIF
jgi:hypothetical protein